MKTKLCWLSSLLLLLTGCATRPDARSVETAQLRATAIQARYQALQEAQRPVSKPDTYEDLPVPLPERTEDGIIRAPAIMLIRIPFQP